MDIQHSQSTRKWQQQVRQFVEQDLIPWEVEAELNNGVIRKKSAKKCSAMRLLWVYQKWMPQLNMAAWV